TGVAALGKEIESLRAALKTKPGLLALLPDVQVFHNAVRYALDYNEFFDAKQFLIAKDLLALGMTRAKELHDGSPSWTSATGPVVRGYVSKIDGSVQPYGLNVPANWKPDDKTPRPLSFWLHGRNDKLSELAFVNGELKAKPEFTPGGGFVVQLYGRFCNANKFAGEADLFEAWDDVRRRYPVDSERVSVLGFSMGGAAAWHFSTHHAGLWAAASAGAGFAETATYAKVFASGKEPPPWWEQVLWRCYDATAYAGNLANTAMIAYSGELDPQKQSADIMEQAMAGEGLKLERFIGPKTAHKYEPETKKQIAARLDEIVAKGREAVPMKVRFTTYTLRYHKMEWLEIDALEKHWERAEIEAERKQDGGFTVQTKNVETFTIAMPIVADSQSKPELRDFIIDGQKLEKPQTDLEKKLLFQPPKLSGGWNMGMGWSAAFHKAGGRWRLGKGLAGDVQTSEANAVTEREQSIAKIASDVKLAKRHGLQGPIDDAFMDSFVFVKPTGKPLNDKVGAWAKSELDRAVTEWRRVFRGEARVVDDEVVSAADIANSNLVLWGDPSSNAVLAKILAKLPITWDATKLTVGQFETNAADHVPILIFPNPLNPQRYVVLNSGFTFREGSNTTNSQQTPKLPDWAVIDLNTPPSAKWPGLVVDAGFFDERWQLPSK
ncbi:MAG: prolyl oligopeptidase family serine peptidase, partial [Chthoniobacteraceae bacterium]